MLKAGAQRLEQVESLGGQLDAAMQAQKQRTVELRLQRLDLAAHRTEGNAKFAGGRGEAAVTRAGIESIQAGQAR